ncbi:Putative transcriptional rgulator [Mycobacteroides abscessus subsp. abscessus]|nr:Putative transcriptional rgulator [Mycobacteroides abscessus subsp. abscessus]
MDRPARRPGPPVDAARLQPDNQGDIHRVDEGLVGAWLDDPDLAAELADELEQLERLRRLQADEELVLALQLEQFTGRLWARFSRELTRYGLGVLRAWIRHGTIYVKAKKLTGYGLGRIEGWPDDQTIDDIATDTVVAALNYFRDKVLKTHRWQSSGGASLGTFFIGQCLYQFANIYRSALRAELERIEQATTPMDELPEDEFDVAGVAVGVCGALGDGRSDDFLDVGGREQRMSGKAVGHSAGCFAHTGTHAGGDDRDRPGQGWHVAGRNEVHRVEAAVVAHWTFVEVPDAAQ